MDILNCVFFSQTEIRSNHLFKIGVKYKKSNNLYYCEHCEVFYEEEYRIEFDDLIGVPLIITNYSSKYHYCIILKDNSVVFLHRFNLMVQLNNNKELACSVTNIEDFETMVNI